MKREIVWRPAAQNDLYQLYDWIAERADPGTAYDYAARIEAHAARLDAFADRGTARSDLGAGIRSLTYRRRTIIVYRIEDSTVVILRIVRAARDLDMLFEGE